ncbi:glycerophosphodiester phosphodiesterase family protein [uncultured Roseobacter sp.]|uniref:glycerophosphodiester phosphodiesterase family protein n=1 Tax=uncultured Roseobacter sp. TaxID=114847 RepID=UPI0026094E94|nr:glycerophosphodiester phosphodiesterase family protein [uncultured Roseobacter sp.]
MKRTTYLGAAALCFAGLTATLGHAATVGTYNTLIGAAPLVIGHRGAAAYLPENSIGGNELAAEMGSDFIETDVMMTKDNVLIAMHDTTLERTTNVEEIYAPRNGGYAVRDFTYEELRALTVNPTGSGADTLPGFTPSADNPYRIPTFADMLDALTAYNKANGTRVGMLTEGKYSDNIDTSRAVIQTLIDKGYDTPEKSVVQSFDFNNVSDYAGLLDAAGLEMGVAQLGVGWPLDDGTLGVLSIGGAFLPLATSVLRCRTVRSLASCSSLDCLSHGCPISAKWGRDTAQTVCHSTGAMTCATARTLATVPKIHIEIR